MRLWSLHPRYLDAKGLVAAWREGLLAQKVARGETRGYRQHPQMRRFRDQPDPVGAVATWLSAICDEAESRGYRFDRSKIGRVTAAGIPVTDGQLEYEWQHLLTKLRARDPDRCRQIQHSNGPEPHPLFYIVPGEIEPWEVTRPALEPEDSLPHDGESITEGG